MLALMLSVCIVATVPEPTSSEAEPMTYYTHTLYYDANGGYGAPSTMTLNDEYLSYTFLISPTVPTRSGYAFIGWSTSSSASTGSYYPDGSISVSSSATLYAVWTTTLYTHSLVYNANGGSGAPATQTVTDGYTAHSFVISSTVPTRSGYNFIAWATDPSTTNPGLYWYPNQTITGVAGTVTLYALWTQVSAHTHTITYDANGGSGAPATQSITDYFVTTTMYISNVMPVREGYTFIGWNTSSSATSALYWANQGVSVSGTLSLYAIWLAESYTHNLYYNAYGGTGAPATQTVTNNVAVFNMTVSSVEPVKEGYVFLGWGINAQNTDPSYYAGDTISVGANAVTLYAKWSAIETQTLMYDANGGSGAPATQTSLENTSTVFTISDTRPTRSGYDFLGWSTNSTATDPSYYSGGTITVSLGNTVTLYAVWGPEGSAPIESSESYDIRYPELDSGTTKIRDILGSYGYIVSRTGGSATGSFSLQPDGLYNTISSQNGASEQTATLDYYYGSSASDITNVVHITVHVEVYTVFQYSILYYPSIATVIPDSEYYAYETGGERSFGISSTVPFVSNNYEFSYYTSNRGDHYDPGETIHLSNPVTDYIDKYHIGTNSLSLSPVFTLIPYRSTLSLTPTDGAFEDLQAFHSYYQVSSETYMFYWDLSLYEEPIWEGHAFSGWSSNLNITTVEYAPGSLAVVSDAFPSNGLLNLFAIWDAEEVSHTHTLVYDANGGVNTPDPEILTDNNLSADMVVVSQTPVYTGFTFLGWSVVNNATTPSYTGGDTISVENIITVYAVWKTQTSGSTVYTHTLVYNSNGGSNPPVGRTVENSSPILLMTISANAPTRDGYVFNGWSTEASAESPMYDRGDAITVGEMTIVLYAVWKEAIYTNGIAIKWSDGSLVTGVVWSIKTPWTQQPIYTYHRPYQATQGIIYDDGSDSAQCTVTGTFRYNISNIKTVQDLNGAYITISTALEYQRIAFVRSAVPQEYGENIKLVMELTEI